jgi:hypothetical protein
LTGSWTLNPKLIFYSHKIITINFYVLSFYSPFIPSIFDVAWPTITFCAWKWVSLVGDHTTLLLTLILNPLHSFSKRRSRENCRGEHGLLCSSSLLSKWAYICLNIYKAFTILCSLGPSHIFLPDFRNWRIVGFHPYSKYTFFFFFLHPPLSKIKRIIHLKHESIWYRYD